MDHAYCSRLNVSPSISAPAYRRRSLQVQDIHLNFEELNVKAQVDPARPRYISSVRQHTFSVMRAI